jgi:hypothetical protein
MSRYDRIIQRFSQRLGKLEKEAREKEFSESEASHPKAASAFLPKLTEYEYYQAQELKGELAERYQDLSLGKVIPGEKITCACGSFYYVFEEINEKCFKPEKEDLAGALLSFFSLLPGIREYREAQLKEAGYKSIEDLISHPRWGKEAESFLKALSQKDSSHLNQILSSRLPKSHPLVLSLSSFHPWEDFFFLDIETLGLFGGNLVILIGLAQLEQGEKIKLHQFLALEVEDEIALLKAFSEHLSKSKSIVSFNGKAFDVPFLEGRLRYYGITPDLKKIHFDLLHFSRRAWKNQLPDCSLDTIEREILKDRRETDLPSSLVPEFYSDYLRTKNYGLLKPIVEHNRQDVLTLVRIFSHLHRSASACQF